MKLRTIAEAEQLLARFVPPARKYREAVLSLEGMRKLMEFLGNPQEDYRVVHVAGSSGKTSTAYYIARLLKESGKTVGLTVSPHITSVNERVQVNLTPLPEKEFCKELNSFVEQIKDAPHRPTYFELLVAFAYWYFSKAHMEYVVVEVGLGGLLDATNVVKNSNKICVITDIGMDHTELLGHSLAEIASQKAGIINDYNKVFCYQQTSEVSEVIREVAQSKRAELHEITPVKRQDVVEDMPLFQFKNWYLASCVVEHELRDRRTKALSDKQLVQSLSQFIPGRMETHILGNKIVILDGAHNSQKMRALLRSIKHLYPHDNISVLLGMLRAKNAKLQDTLSELVPHVNHITITTFTTRQDMRKISADPTAIVNACEALDFHDYQIFPDPLEAYKKTLQLPDQILLVTGSFYLQEHVRPGIGK